MKSSPSSVMYDYGLPRRILLMTAKDQRGKMTGTNELIAILRV